MQEVASASRVVEVDDAPFKTILDYLCIGSLFMSNGV